MKTTLVIMAAGIGSRFGGGIKQLAKVDAKGHIIMDYSIHDALSAGFNKIVFIIRRDIEAEFKEAIGNRIEAICNAKGATVAYCFQDLNEVPGQVPEGRTKPWGTGQAVLAAKEVIEGPFAVINADDYYGKQAYAVLHDWLVAPHDDTAIAMVGFVLKNTLSDNGSVTRGLCKVDENGQVTDVVETHNILKVDGLPQADGIQIDPETYVSMNMWGFPAKENQPATFLTVLEEGFVSFFKETVPENPLKSEYLLPILIGGMLQQGDCSVNLLPSQDKWFGVTYAEDKAQVVESFRQLIQDGVYKEDLYAED